MNPVWEPDETLVSSQLSLTLKQGGNDVTKGVVLAARGSVLSMPDYSFPDLSLDIVCELVTDTVLSIVGEFE